ncbi:MAG: tetratricopeptide repeat protein [Myxococcota bacterium]
MRKTPQTADEWFAEGEWYLDLSRGADTGSEYTSDLTNAVAAFEQTLARDPSHRGAARHRAFTLAQLGRLEEALDAFVTATHAEPDDAGLWLSLGQCLARLGRHDSALDAFERVLALRTEDAEALFGRAEALTALGRHSQALQAWDAVLAEPDNRTLNLHGRTVRVLTDDFRRAQARQARAHCLERVEAHRAQATWREAFEAEGAKLPIARGKFIEALRTSDPARRAYREYLAARATEAPAWFRAGDAFRAAGLHADARAAYETLVRLVPENPHAWFNKAETHAVVEEYDEALAAFRHALELWPEFSGAATRMKLVEAERRARGR